MFVDNSIPDVWVLSAGRSGCAGIWGSKSRGRREAEEPEVSRRFPRNSGLRIRWRHRRAGDVESRAALLATANASAIVERYCEQSISWDLSSSGCNTWTDGTWRETRE